MVDQRYRRFPWRRPGVPVLPLLIVRWFQYGVFLPALPFARSPDSLSLTGTTGGPNEVLVVRATRPYVIIRDLLFLRARLKLYILAQMAAALR